MNFRARKLQRWYESLSRTKQIRYVVGSSAIIVVLCLVAAGGGDVSAVNIEVIRGSLSQVVSVTGRMKAVQAVELAFQNSGRIARADATIGDHVVAGQLLASLDNAELGAQLRDAQANVLAQQAKLNDIEGGGRAEEIAIKESELRAAQQSLDNAYANVYDVLSDAYTKTDNAMRVQLLSMFTDDVSGSTVLFTLTFSCTGTTDTIAFCNQQAALAETSRINAEIGLNAWKQELTGLIGSPTPEAYTNAIDHARGYLQSAKDTISAIGAMLSDSSIGLTAATLETYRTSISTARASVVAASVAVNTQDQLISTYSLAAERIAHELALTRAGSTANEIAAQRAALLSAQAQADRISALIGKNMIRSPIAGIVTQQDAKVGQSATANQALISVISDQELEIEANVPEVDIGEVSVGNVVRLTVDALPNDHFTAKVTFIDPAETIIDGVVNFRVLVLLDTPDNRLKSGLTANLDIETIRKNDVLMLPQFAIIENDDGTFVKKVTGETSVEVPVTLGIRGEDGTVEILSGLQEGDRVVNIGLKSQ